MRRGRQEMVEQAWVILSAQAPDGETPLLALDRQEAQAVAWRKEGPLGRLAEVLLRLSEE